MGNTGLIIAAVLIGGSVIAWRVGYLCRLVPLGVGCEFEREGTERLKEQVEKEYPTAPAPKDRCFRQSTGPKGSRTACQCQGQDKPFLMGPAWNQKPQTAACRACKEECNKRRVALAEEFEPDIFDGLSYAGYTSMGREQLNMIHWA